MEQYQIGNNVYYNNHYVKLLELYKDKCLIQYQDGTQLYVSYNEIKPIVLEDKVLKDWGSKVVTERVYEFHKMRSYEVNVRGKIYFLKGYIYADNSIWHFNTMSLHYFHQLQNLCKIINPEYDPGLF